jgi:hypothetical protein
MVYRSLKEGLGSEPHQQRLHPTIRCSVKQAGIQRTALTVEALKTRPSPSSFKVLSLSRLGEVRTDALFASLVTAFGVAAFVASATIGALRK